MLTYLKEYLRDMQDMIQEDERYAEFIKLLETIKTHLLTSKSLQIPHSRLTEAFPAKPCAILVIDDAHRLSPLTLTHALSTFQPQRLVLITNPLYQMSVFRTREDLIFRLQRQMRMEREVQNFVEAVLGDGRVGRCLGYGDRKRLYAPSGTPLNRIMPPVAFYDLTYLNDLADDNPKVSDDQEAQFVMSLLSRVANVCIEIEKKALAKQHKEREEKVPLVNFLRMRLPLGMSCQRLFNCSIGVIVPYADMIPKYKEIFARLQFVSLLDIEIGVAEDFSGREKDVIIVSHLRPRRDESNTQRLGDFTSTVYEESREFSLALSRPKKFLWLVGNLKSIINYNSSFGTILDYFGKKEHKKMYFDFENQSSWRDRDSLHDRLFGDYPIRPRAQEKMDERLHEQLSGLGKDPLEQRATALSSLIGVKRIAVSETIAGGYKKKDTEGGHYNNVRP